MASHYRRGADFERRVRDRLYKDGAAFVIRAAQSKGQVDLLALWPRPHRDDVGYMYWEVTPWLVQCKTGKARMSALQKLDLVDLAQLVGGLPILAEPGPNGRGVRFTDLQTGEVNVWGYHEEENNGKPSLSTSGSIQEDPQGAVREDRL